jgi:type IV pilus assembly protein PilB
LRGGLPRKQLTTVTRDAARGTRPLWHDRWLIAAFRRLSHAAVERLTDTAETAWEALEESGVSADQLLETVCAMSHAAPAKLDTVDAQHAPLLDRMLAERYHVVPVQLADGWLHVATANPLHPNLDRDLAFATGQRVRLLVASPADVRRAMSRVYPGARRDSAAIDWSAQDRRSGSLAAPQRGEAVEMLDSTLAEALALEASDIHLEPRERGLHVRYRLDGVLHDGPSVPEATAQHVMSRLKIMAGLDIADRLRPQDGSATVTYNGRSVDLRISTLPLGRAGEKAVIRILEEQMSRLTFAQLGFLPAEGQRLERLLRSTEGVVLVTGPTGSGKTTTLYAALRFVKSTGTNVVSIEDPVEYRLEGINQVEVDERSGLTFAAALRSVLRQDPDVVLVGEIRDGETAGIAIKASMTGHLVLSTLHTNDAPSAVARLLDVGADRVAVSSALKGVVAQRLIRRLCQQCALPLALADLPLDQQALLADRDGSQLRRSVGCAACRHTGYRGRTVLAEILFGTTELQQAVARGALEELPALAAKGGMRSLWSAGLDLVTAGTTSLHELLDNVAAPLVGETKAQADVDALLKKLLPQREATPMPRAAQPKTGRRVLIVDEDRAARQSTREILERDGWSVIEASDGETALAYVRRLRPDLVVAELTLARLDGIGLVQALKAEQGPRTVIHTGQTDDALLQWAQEAGAAAVVPKSGDLVSVLRALQTG